MSITLSSNGCGILEDDDDDSSSQTTTTKLGYLKAYSGTLQGCTSQDGFCPIIYDRTHDAQGFFNVGEEELNQINYKTNQLQNNPERKKRKERLIDAQQRSREALAYARKKQKANKEKRRLQREEMKRKCSNDNNDDDDISSSSKQYKDFEEQMKQESAFDQREFKALKAKHKKEVQEKQKLVNEIEDEIEYLKKSRKEKSNKLQNQLFDQYQFLNTKKEKESLLPIFDKTPLRRPPSGAGDCVAPKLFQHAFRKGYVPIAMAEFWWGKSPSTEVRRHGLYYPACRGKCEPILGHMLEGLAVEENPLDQIPQKKKMMDVACRRWWILCTKMSIWQL
mmetsp:Transcript_35282/g.51730  ORF Transcript_35282/g.51730 Transcript_35282/m.51730 type:complete len:336 (-) Transcript_35282:919-1926(-)